MKLGIFSKMFSDYSIEQAFSIIKEYGFEAVQLNMSNVGLESLPEKVDKEHISSIKKAKEKHNMSIPVLSGTFNTLELNASKRKDNLNRFNNVLDVAEALDIRHVSISTGSMNQKDFWSPHPDNRSDKAWELLLDSLDTMLAEATKRKITIVIEPEQANVIQTAKDAIRLMEHYDSKYLKILYDPANVMIASDKNKELKKIKDTLALLHPYIAVAHLKDFDIKDNAVVFASVGKGRLPIQEYLNELNKYYDGYVIMHGLEVDEISEALNKVKGKR